MRHGFENTLNNVVRIAARELSDVECCPCLSHESGEEFLHQLGVKIADLCRRDLDVIAKVSTPRQVNGGKHQRLVHRQNHIAVAGKPLFVTAKRKHSLPEANADILSRVVIVNVGIPRAGERKVKSAVTGKEREHMVKEAAARLDLCLAAAATEGQGDIGLCGLSFDFYNIHIGSPL